MKHSYKIATVALIIFALTALAATYTRQSTMALGTTYYVDSVSGSDANSGTSANAPWKTVGKVNSTTFSPGDTIRFKRGATWRDAALRVTASGQSGAPITYGTYGSGAAPVLSGADVVNTWTNLSGNIYYSSWNFNSNAAFQSGTALKRATSTAGMTAGSFYVDQNAGRIYVWTTGGSSPANYTIEATRRGAPLSGLVDIDNKQHIVIENLRLLKSNYYGIRLKDGGNYTIQGNVIEQSYHTAIQTSEPEGARSTSNVKVINNTLLNNGLGRVGPVSTNETESVGVLAASWLGTGSVISGNTITNQGGDGIRALAGTDNLVIEKNRIVNAAGHGIYLSAGWQNSYVTGSDGGNVSNNVVRYNYVESGSKTTGSPVALTTEQNKALEGTLVHNNVIKANGGGSVAVLYGTGGQGGGTVGPLKNNKIYNNTIVNAFHGIRAAGPTSDATNEFRNNIIVLANNGQNKGFAYKIDAPTTGSNAAANYSANYDLIFTPNGPGGFIAQWGPSSVVTLAQLRQYQNQGANSVFGDPLFTNAGAGDYSLQTLSPARNKGANLGSPFNLALDPTMTWSSVKTLDQSQQGLGWEMGAYAYSENSYIQIQPISTEVEAPTCVLADTVRLPLPYNPNRLDRTVPTVSLVFPVAMATVPSTPTITVTARDNQLMYVLQVLINSKVEYQIVTQPVITSYTHQIDRILLPGWHCISVLAVDKEGNAAFTLPVPIKAP